MSDNIIKIRLEQSGMSITQAAVALGASAAAICKWKAGSPPSDTTLLEWASGTPLQQGLARELLRQRYPGLHIYAQERRPAPMATGNKGNGCTCLPGSTLCPACRGE